MCNYISVVERSSVMDLGVSPKSRTLLPVDEKKKGDGQRGSYTESNRSGQPYIPGAHESLKPPYTVNSPRSRRVQVLEGIKSEDEVWAEIYHHSGKKKLLSSLYVCFI